MDDWIDLSIVLNGTPQALKVRPNWTLLRVLREQLGITSVREGCSEGQCGACTVLLNGDPVPSCILLAGTLEKAEIVTLEGLKKGDRLHPLQEAFHNFGAVQCGFCTPGMILSAYSLLKKKPRPSEKEIIRAMDDNLCRCGAHPRIIRAIQSAAREMKEQRG